MSHGPEPSTGASSPSIDHDANAKAVVERFLGGEAAVLDGATSRSSRDSTAT